MNSPSKGTNGVVVLEHRGYQMLIKNALESLLHAKTHVFSLQVTYDSGSMMDNKLCLG